MSSVAPFLFSVSLGVLVAGLLSSRPGSGPDRGGRKRERDEASRRPGREQDRPGLGLLIVRAGRDGELSVGSVKAIRVVALLALPLIALPVADLLPGRFGILLVAVAAVLGFLAPALVLERTARIRRERILAALPDALDLLSVQVGAGRSIGAAMEGFARSGRGPLAVEFGIAADEIARGMPQSVALGRLRQRNGSREIVSFCALVDRSRRLGSPLAVELRRQASAIRIDQGRAVAEKSARAAPKIQLVIALILVPAVMLLVAAALVANSDRLLGFAFG